MVKSWRVFAWFNYHLANLTFEFQLLTYEKKIPQVSGVIFSESDRNVAPSFTDTENSRAWFQKSDWLSSVGVCVCAFLCDIIYREIAIQESLWSFCLQLHLWILVLESLKLGLPPHLLPLITWIKPPPINFFLPQILLASITHKTLQLKCSDYCSPTHHCTLIGWRESGLKWLPIWAKFCSKKKRKEKKRSCNCLRFSLKSIF